MQNETARIREIYCQALEYQSGGEREAFVDSVCGDDIELKKQVQELIDARSVLGDFLGGTVALDEGNFASAGTDIGPYKLREKIGEGGFGVVYVAEQKEPVSRKVALKVIKPGMDSQDIIARFEAERQALAMMNHPNVAKVLDAGATETGRPYFVMELVHGVAITQYCDSKKLDNRQRLELFIDVCHAVQHAHQKGIIHRDLKPSNIMVTMADHRPVVKVIDFGVAKALHHDLTDKSIYTRYGQMVGTPLYMSPEQAQMNSLDVDTRSDIYSMGVVLYQLLTGTTPFDGETFQEAGLDEVRRMIREVEPRRPSEQVSTLKAEQISTISDCRNVNQASLIKSLRGELDWILLKSLEKDRTRRYETANALADDVQRFLRDEPVIASPPSTVYLFKKFARRNKIGIAFACLTALFLVAGVIGLSVSNYLITQSKNETLAALIKADDNLKLAQENEKQARTEAAIADAISEFVNTDLLGKFDPHDEPNRDLKVIDVLNQAILSIEGKFSDHSPMIEAGIRSTIANSLQSLGRYDELESQVQAVRDIYLKEGLDSTDRRLLRVEALLAWNLHERGLFKQSLKKMMPLLGICKQALGAEDRYTLKTGVRVADLHRHLGKYVQAEKQLREIITVQERAFGTSDGDTLYSKLMLASLIGIQGRYEEGAQISGDVYEICNRKYGAEHRRTLRAKSKLAEFKIFLLQFTEAETMLRDVHGISRRVLGVSHYWTVKHLQLLAESFIGDGRHDQAEELLRESIEELTIIEGQKHSLTLELKDHLAKVLIARGKYDDAEQICRDLEAAKFDVLSRFADLYQRQLKLAQAEITYRKLIESRIQKLGPEHPVTLNGVSKLAGVIEELGRYADAEKMFRDVIAAQTRVLGEENPGTLASLHGLASTLSQQGKDFEATKIINQVLEVQKRQLRPNHPDTLKNINTLAVHFWRNGQLDKSIPLFEELAEGFKAEFGENHPETYAVIANLGVNYNDAGQLDKAVLHLEEVHRAAKSHPRLAPVATLQLIDAYVKHGEPDQAEALVPEYLNLVRSKLPKNMVALFLANVARKYYLATDQFVKAEELFRESLTIYKEIMPDDWKKFVVMFRLGLALAGQRKFDDAEPLLSEGFAGLLKRKASIPPSSIKGLNESISQISKVYDAAHVDEPSKGYDTKARFWKKKLDEIQGKKKTEESK